MIVYFGRDERGYFADSEGGVREYVTEEIWRMLVAVGASAGADTHGVDVVNGSRVPLCITEQACVQKFEGDQLIETVQLTPETTTF